MLEFGRKVCASPIHSLSKRTVLSAENKEAKEHKQNSPCLQGVYILIKGYQ